MYRINTAGPCFTEPTLKDARRKARLLFSKVASKRGYSLVEGSYPKKDRRVTVFYVQVLNSKGRAVSGCVFYKCS